MPWNWEMSEWPHFNCNFDRIAQQEREFLLNMKRVEYARSECAQKAIQISRIAKLVSKVYETFDAPLTHEMLWDWHAQLCKDAPVSPPWGKYRTRDTPMEIIAHRGGFPRLLFEAPPSSKVREEMERFLSWFNVPSKPILGRAAIAMVYFVSIHPFHDGNGRVARALVEKVLSQGIRQPTQIALAAVLEKGKQDFMCHLEACNRSLEIQPWLECFAHLMVQESRRLT